MRAVLQRVTEARVTVSERVTGEIGPGLMVLVGVATDDTPEDAAYIAKKIAELRIFEDGAGKLNRSLLDTGGSALIVSQFTLQADTRKGRRPAFSSAAPSEIGEALYEEVVARVRERGVPVATGDFGAMMRVSLVNDGPVTLIIDSRDKRA